MNIFFLNVYLIQRIDNTLISSDNLWTLKKDLRPWVSDRFGINEIRAEASRGREYERKILLRDCCAIRLRFDGGFLNGHGNWERGDEENLQFATRRAHASPHRVACPWQDFLESESSTVC